MSFVGHRLHVDAHLDGDAARRRDRRLIEADIAVRLGQKLDAGLIDSTGILELVAFLESQFGIRMADADIVPANLDSIQAIVGYVDTKRASAAAA